MTTQETVEESAQKLFFYEKTMELNLIELRKDPANLKAVHRLVAKFHVSSGHLWPPEPNQHDGYMKFMNEITSRHPSSDTDRMEVVLACHSASNCYMLFYIPELATETQERIMSRYQELSLAFAKELMVMQQQNTMHAQSLGDMLAPNSYHQSQPYSSPPMLTRHLLTLEEKSTYVANPITAIGKHFILDPDSTDPLPFKIAGVRASEEKVIYEVLLDGCFHVEDLEQHEVESMMDTSDVLG